MKLAFFASHNGSNAKAIIDACAAGMITAEPVLLISNNADSGALGRAREANLLAFHFSSKSYPSPAELDTAILDVLEKSQIDLIILAGYMRILGLPILQRYQGRVLNIHPSLLPKFGGKGMYGMHVHRAVLEAQEVETGATIHLVTENYDEGPIVAQMKVPVLAGDTPEILAQRVLQVEHELYVDTVRKIASGHIALPIPMAPCDDILLNPQSS
jgi:phosphoribosylglycinamide formyltransferase-1